MDEKEQETKLDELLGGKSEDENLEQLPITEENLKKLIDKKIEEAEENES